MPKSQLLPAVAIFAILSSMMGCASSHEYVTKLFGSRPENPVKDTQLIVRFLELDSLNAGKESWVTTKITTDSSAIKDTASKSIVESKQIKALPMADLPVDKTMTSTTRRFQPMPVIIDAQGARSKRTRDNDRSQK